MSDVSTVTTVVPARRAGSDAANGELLDRVKQLRLDTQLGAAKTGRGGGAGWLPWLLCVLLAGTWALVGIRGYRAPKDDGSTAAAVDTGSAGKSASPPSPGGTSPATAADSGTVQVEVKGYLVPARQIAVSPIDVAGLLVELNVIEGKYYKEGDLLARIDPVSFQAALDEAEAAKASAEKKLEGSRLRREELRTVGERPTPIRLIEIQQIKAQIQEAEAQRSQKRDEYRRLSQLSAGGVSGRELDQARNEDLAAEARVIKLRADLDLQEKGPREEKVLAAEADVKAAEAEVKAAEARLSQARWRVGNCTIKAPISGTVLTKKAEKGNLVNPLAFAATSGSVCDMADLADLEADLEIPERQIAQLKVGQPCRIRADAYPDKLYTGVLDRIMPIANRAKSIVNVRVKVKLPDGETPGTYLKPEMGAVVSFLPVPADKK